MALNEGAGVFVCLRTLDLDAPPYVPLRFVPIILDVSVPIAI